MYNMSQHTWVNVILHITFFSSWRLQQDFLSEREMWWYWDNSGEICHVRSNKGDDEIRLTDRFRCLPFIILKMMSAHSNHITFNICRSAVIFVTGFLLSILLAILMYETTRLNGTYHKISFENIYVN